MPDRQGAPAPGPVLVLTPTGRDAQAATRLLNAEGIDTVVHDTLRSLQAAMGDETGALLLADEALIGADLSVLISRVADRPPWSDLPFIVLTQAGFAARKRLGALDLPARLGNVVFLERPLNAMGLLSTVKSALRGRQRQRQVRDHLLRQAEDAARATALLEARVVERTEALERAGEERRGIAAALAQSQKMEAVGQLTGGLAHDFNNMLTGIIASLDLMQTRLAQGRTEQVGRYVGMARQSADRAAALTHRLLAFSRRQTLDAKPTGVNALVLGMVELIRSTVGPGIGLELDAAEDLWTTLCDPHQLENALLNLCINARDAMPGGGTLLVTTTNVHVGAAEAAAMREAAAGEYVTLAVTDSGTGMPPEVIALAFDPFFTTKPIGQGTGLGLSMIYGFAQQSGGHVQIDSRVGRGTTVRLFLPRFDGPERDMPAPLTGATAKGNGGTVLVVDDEDAVRTLLSDVLADHGYVTLMAADGPAGLRLLRTDVAVDLLVTDVGMPGGMNGRQLADAARAVRPGLKVLFITGYAENVLSREALAPGMEVLTKPFTTESLAGRVRGLLG